MKTVFLIFGIMFCVLQNLVPSLADGKIRYFPVNLDWQIRTAEKLRLNPEELLPEQTEDRYVDRIAWPEKKHKIIGDGNCLFRSISYYLNGNQEKYTLVRQLIIKTMLHPSYNWFFEAIADNFPAHVLKMRRNTEWGTDIELFAASALLNTTVNVFTEFGGGNENKKQSKATEWTTFDISEHIPRPMEQRGIYLSLMGQHFEPVLSIGDLRPPQMPGPPPSAPAYPSKRGDISVKQLFGGRKLKPVSAA